MAKLDNFLSELDNFITLEEAREGVIVTVTGAGEITDAKGTFKPQLVLPVELNGEERSIGLNGSTVKALAEKHGKETKEWVGLKMKVYTKKYGANEGRAAEWLD